jgi:predicted amidohydrolase
MIRIAANQLAPTIADFSANEELSIATVHRCVADGVQLIVMPELTLSGYMLASAEEVRSVAITADHPVFTAWSAAVAAVNGVVIGGFAELDDGLVYNSVAVVDGTGFLAVYRKTHLWDKEKLIFTPGAVAPPVIETSLGRLGVIVCYDLEFPEMTRSLALRGAELIVVPTNWPLEINPAGERPPEVTIAMSAAHINHVGIVCCDRSGTERGQRWNQGTCIINEQGWIIAATSHKSGTAIAELDLYLSRDKTISALCDAFGDRRPELYSAVTASKKSHGIANQLTAAAV